MSKAGSEEDLAQKQKDEVIKTVGVVAGVALIGWAISKLVSGSGEKRRGKND